MKAPLGVNLQANPLVTKPGHKLLQLQGAHKSMIEVRKKGLPVLRWYESDKGEAEAYTKQHLNPQIPTSGTRNLMMLPDQIGRGQCRVELRAALNLFAEKNLDIVDCILCAKAWKNAAVLFTFDDDLKKIWKR